MTKEQRILNAKMRMRMLRSGHTKVMTTQNTTKIIVYNWRSATQTKAKANSRRLKSAHEQESLI